MKGTDDKMQSYGLEFFATDHCNLKCYGCAQNSPFLDNGFADPDVFEKSLNVLSKYLNPNKITFLGGEALLHPEIDSLIMIAQKSKMFNRVHVTTNGLNLNKMSSLFWSSIDVLRVSKYPITHKYINHNIDEWRVMCRDYNVELQIREMDWFNYITLSEENQDRALIYKIFKKCIYKTYCHTLRGNKLYRCSPSVNLKQALSRISDTTTSSYDYLEVNETLEHGVLLNFLTSDAPLNCCSFCLGSSGKTFPHRQLTPHELASSDLTTVSEETYDNNR